MITAKPLVSVGMPVYNEERFLAKTLDSLRSQDYDNLEIIISDNLSSDKTPEICQAYAKLDQRIRYYPATRNIGLIRNFNRVFQLSSGEYFMWASGHDLWEKHYIRTCLEDLLNNPQIVLSSGQYYHINEEGRLLDPVNIQIHTRGLAPGKRFWKVIRDRASFYAPYGLFRKTALAETRLKVDTYFPDLVLIAELSLLGEFSFSNPCTTLLRNFLHRDTEEGDNESKKAARLLPQDAPWTKRLLLARFPFTQFTFEILRILYRSKLPFAEKWRYTFDALAWKNNVFREFTTRWIPRKARKAFKQIISLKAAL